MKIINGLDQFINNYENVCLALGTFDGIHKGHQALIKKAVSKAKEVGGHSIVVTFSNHPLSLINKNRSPKLINSNQEKFYLLKKLGVDVVLSLDLNDDLINMTPELFFTDILLNKLHAKNIFVGFNYHFGKNGKGDSNTLLQLGKLFDINIEVVSPITYDGEVISSSRIRSLIQNGKLGEAEECLGFPLVIMGEVLHGKKLGRKMGFPTANLKMYNKIYPPYGIYGITVVIEGENIIRDGLMNIGENPTLKPDEISAEVHIFDFDQDIYDKELTVKIVKYLRGQKKFNGMDELKKEIQNDVKIWKSYLANKKN